MTGQQLYTLAMYTAVAGCAVYGLIVSKTYKIEKLKMVVITALAMVWNGGISHFAAWVEAGFKTPVSVDIVRCWVYAPVYLLMCSVIFNVDFNRISDAVTPAYILSFVISHFGCIAAGCCHGYPYEGKFAIYNKGIQCNVFPVQVLEIIVCFFVFLCFVFYVVKTKGKVSGKMYPAMLIVFAGRFFLDFLRDNDKVIWGCSSPSFHALFGGLVGIIWLVILNKVSAKSDKADSAPAEKCFAEKISKNQAETLFGKEIKRLFACCAGITAAIAVWVIYLVDRIKPGRNNEFCRIIITLFFAFLLFCVGFFICRLVLVFRSKKRAAGKEDYSVNLAFQGLALICAGKKAMMIKPNKCENCGSRMYISISDGEIAALCKNCKAENDVITGKANGKSEQK